ncbi:MAG: alpha-L-glutamate ligase-like protein [Candidatus Binatia bacterium]
MKPLASIARFRREVLGLNRRNQEYVFRHNSRALFHLVDDKIGTKAALASAGIPVPKSFAVFEVQRDLRRLGWALRRLVDFVMKPARGSGGGGVLSIVGREGERFLKGSGAALTQADLEDHASDILAGAYARNQRQDEALVEYRIRPESVVGAMSYGGVADFRFLVFQGVPVLAMMRLPTRLSDGRANLHMGGIGVGIDLAAGVTTGAFGRGRAIERHPDLGTELVGVRLPHWEEMLDIAARCHEPVPLGFFGADLVLDAERGPMVLEINARPGLGIQLANRRGLRPVLEAVEAARPARLSVPERIALGKEIFAKTV